MKHPAQSFVPTARFCEISQLSYLQAGEHGPAVVLLHGWSAFKELWWSTLLSLEPHARAYAPDLPGHGGSAFHGAADMRAVAQRIAAFCAARGLDRIALVGHSMGGNLALELALAQPALVERLVLVDAAVQTADLPRYTRSYTHAGYGWASLRMSMALGRRLGLLGQRVPHAHNGGLLMPALRRVGYFASHDASALRAMLESLFANPLDSRLAELQVPTLVISGALDPLVPPVLSRRVAQAIPGARYVVMRGAGHNPMDERPRAFIRLLRDFLGIV